MLPHPASQPSGHRQALEATLFGAKLPALMVPASLPHPAPPFCRHLAVGWRDSQITRHALAAFAPFVEAAEKVTVIEVIEGRGSPTERARTAVCRRRSDATFDMVAPASTSTGATLLAAASRSGADTLLIGAHRHNVLQAWIFGTVTQTIISEAPMPILTVAC